MMKTLSKNIFNFLFETFKSSLVIGQKSKLQVNITIYITRSNFVKRTQ